MYSISRFDGDADELKDAHRLAFPADRWLSPEDQEFWIARDEIGAMVGFASAQALFEHGCLFLSRAAVVQRAAGAGLQRRLIRERLKWGRKQGLNWALTYVASTNYASLKNLFDCGFRGIEKHSWGCKWHVVIRNLQPWNCIKNIEAVLKILA